VPAESRNRLGSAAHTLHSRQSSPGQQPVTFARPAWHRLRHRICRTGNGCAWRIAGPAGSERPRSGFLVSVRGATLHVPRLDDIAADLDIEAACIHSSGDNILYQFTLHAAGRLLLDGRAAVMLDADTITGAST
jgi:hypothetical protein